MYWWHSNTVNAKHDSPFQMSRAATVQVIAHDINSSGTGFFVGPDLILTCFHVVAVPGRQSLTLGVRTSAGEMIPARVLSHSDPSPSAHDFAYLQLSHPPVQEAAIANFSRPDERSFVGDAVVYSGFPLATPGMFTARGMLAGRNDEESSLFVQGPINKGNSGGALINTAGRVTGIITAREGGISGDFEDLQNYIAQTNQQVSVSLAGVNMLHVISKLISTLDEHISTGIGYATDIKFAREFAERHFQKKPMQPPALT